jgi:ubiquinone/menaquinone biosynthesis C-methylase UbiE
MSFGGWLFAAMYDRMLAGVEKAGLRERRARLLEAARGKVLEIGAGTGANLPLYGPGVESLTVTEPEAPMARRLAKHLREQSRAAQLVEAGAERLPLPDGEFDAVVSTLVLCTVADPGRALQEIRRVLKPGGQLLFIEHVRSDDPNRARWQDRLHKPWFIWADGCNCNRPVLDQLRGAVDVDRVERATWLAMPRIVQPLVYGRAVTAA